VDESCAPLQLEPSLPLYAVLLVAAIPAEAGQRTASMFLQLSENRDST
jgi:hypothetical protein